MKVLDSITDYLIEHGMEENEVDHFLKERIFGGKSILDLIKEGKTTQAQEYAEHYMNGESW